MAKRRNKLSDGAVYESPLVARNASADMAANFSPIRRASTWRRIWLALAEAEREMGLPISAAQIRALRAAQDKINLRRVAEHERRLRHDVMAHLHAFADEAPSARGILHMGATSMDVVDNADLILMREALGILEEWLATVVDAMARQARAYRDLPCLGFTHYQPAQLTTVGKRISLWCWDFLRDLDEVSRLKSSQRFRGIRGATGTQASFLKLFDGNAAKVARLESLVAKKLGFTACEPVTGQTYSRKVDAQVVAALANIAAGVHKFANDIRLLANLKEIEEPFERAQIGSSAMPYKRNPMLCERATGLARFVISLATSGFQTAAEQWLERTLDDSSNKRLLIPEVFLATDGMLQIAARVAGGLVVNRKVISAHINAELPFIASEDILMAAVKSGGDRQALHERIRVHSQAAGTEVKQHGRPNDLIDRLRSDKAFSRVPLDKVLAHSSYVGLAPQQVDGFLKHYVGADFRRRYAKIKRRRAEIKV